MSDFECSDCSDVLCCAVCVLQVHIEQDFWCDRFSCKQLLLSPKQQACCEQLTAITLQFRLPLLFKMHKILSIYSQENY